MSAPKPVRHVGICGIGQMGAAASVSFKRAGYSVLLWARNASKLAAVEPNLIEIETWMDEHMGSPPRDGGSLQCVTQLDSLDEQADLVMDCIAEELDQKVDLFSRMPRSIERGAIFITTTSGLSITEMGRRSGTEHLLAGTHFWNPPHLMPLVEVIRGERTPAEIVDRVCDVIESIGKIPVRVNRDVPGFIGNRLLHAMWREAIHLVQEGIATPEDIDLVARLTFGLRMPAVGPLENMDLVGLDLIHKIHQYLLADLADDHEPLAALSELVSRGDLGMDHDQGFYDWRNRDANELVERRDLQIVRQLEFLRERVGL